jgi:hypothetical protein
VTRAAEASASNGNQVTPDIMVARIARCKSVDFSSHIPTTGLSMLDYS